MAGNLQCEEQKKMQPRILYPASLSFKTEAEVKVSQKNTEGIHHHSTSRTRDPKRDSVSEMFQGPQSTRDITISMKPTDITMTLNPYLSIITLNVNGLNAPTKRHRVGEWIKNKTHLFAVYRRLIKMRTPPD